MAVTGKHRLDDMSGYQHEAISRGRADGQKSHDTGNSAAAVVRRQRAASRFRFYHWSAHRADDASQHTNVQPALVSTRLRRSLTQRDAVILANFSHLKCLKPRRDDGQMPRLACYRMQCA